MSDQLGHVEVATNGNTNGKRNGTDPSEHVDQVSSDSLAQSTEERLDRLMETIQSWDWRAPRPDVDEPALQETAASVSALRTTTSADAGLGLVGAPRDDMVAPPDSVVAPAEPVDVRPQPADVQPETGVASAPLVDVRPQPADVQPEPVVAPPAPVDVRPEPVLVPHASPTRIDDAASPATAPHAPMVALEQLPPPAPVTEFGPEDPEANGNSEPLPWPEIESAPAPDAGPLRRLWSHRWTKAVVLGLVSVAAVLLIIWSIRLAHNPGGSNGSSGTSTTVSQSGSNHGSATPPSTAFVAPVTADQLTRYKTYAGPYEQANETASRAIASAGSTPTTAQLAAAVAAYHYAVNLYDFQLRFIQWPASMQASIADDHAQLEALVSFLASYSTVSSTNMGGWLSGLHIRTAAAETTDNLVRRDLGLPSLNSYPT